VIYPLATLGTARAAALQGDVARAKGAYAEFLRLWRGADAHLAPLNDAQREAAALR
jgi:hypothetical protein